MKPQLRGNFDFQDQKVEDSQLPISSEASPAKAEVSQSQIKESEPPPTIISSEASPAKAEVSQPQIKELYSLVTYIITTIQKFWTEFISLVHREGKIAIVVTIVMIIRALVSGNPMTVIEEVLLTLLEHSLLIIIIAAIVVIVIIVGVVAIAITGLERKDKME